MNCIETVFGKAKVVLPVIHVRNHEQVIRNAALALQCGVKGIWLISHGKFQPEGLRRLRYDLWSQIPELWVGINFLGKPVDDVFAELADDISICDGVWCDNSGIDGDRNLVAEKINEQRMRAIAAGWKGLYFGGFDFKYQPSIPQSRRGAAAEAARNRLDVLTTSGMMTGYAPGLGKIEQIHKGAGDLPIAIASGITPENAAAYVPYTDAFMVATGISSNFYDFDEPKLKRLVEVVQGS